MSHYMFKMSSAGWHTCLQSLAVVPDNLVDRGRLKCRPLVIGDEVTAIWLGSSSSSSSSSTNFIATQVLKQNFRAAMCHALHYSCNVNAAVADSLHCRMICGTVPFSVHAWSPAATHSKSFPRQRGRRDRRWSCATTVEHTATVTMQIAGTPTWLDVSDPL